MGIIAPAALFSANAMSIRTTLKHRYESLAYPKATLIIGVVLLFGLIWLLVSGGEDAPTAPAALKTVTVATVSELSGDGSTLTVVGDLRAASQADLRMERAGRGTGIYAKSGDRVAAGAVIAEIENASERARVLSAQGSLQGAQAALAKLLAGDRPEDRASTEADLKSAEQSLSQAKLSAVTAFRQGYANAQSAIESNVDSLFRDAESVDPKFFPSTKEYETSQRIEAERVAIGEMLSKWEAEISQIDTKDDLTAVLANGQERLDRINNFLNTISSAVAAQAELQVSRSTIDAQQSVVASARASVNAGLSGLASSRTALAAASSAAAKAEAGVEIDDAGARTEDIAAERAKVTQAQGALAAAVADLNATRIRAPFAGIVSSLSLSLGGFTEAQKPAATIVSENGDAWVIETYVSPEDRSRIEEGAQATISDVATGTVATIAPGVDPATQKVRVDINLSSKPESLAPGQTVRASIQTTATSTGELSVAIPLSALKLTPDSAFVFTVNAENILVARPVVVGTVSGDRAIIESGLSPEVEILVDARGRREGETVMVAGR